MGRRRAGAKERAGTVKSSTAQQWRECFNAALRRGENATPLEAAAELKRLGDWTAALTRVVVEASQAFGWRAAAKGHRLDLLPVSQQEYLSLDAVAFPPGEKRWQFPVAVFELENSQSKDRIAYSLWKLLCVKAQLRIVFCYRAQAHDAPLLMNWLKVYVLRSMSDDARERLEGETVLVIGNRGENESFPYGYFKWWLADVGTSSFDPF